MKKKGKVSKRPERMISGDDEQMVTRSWEEKKKPSRRVVSVRSTVYRDAHLESDLVRPVKDGTVVAVGDMLSEVEWVAKFRSLE